MSLQISKNICEITSIEIPGAIEVGHICLVKECVYQKNAFLSEGADRYYFLNRLIA